MNERKELIERLRSYGPGVLGGPVMAQAADMLEADGKAGYHVCVDGVHVPDDVVKKAVFLYMTMDMQPAVPQEPVRNDMSIQLLERLIKTLTNLGCATPEGGIEAFNADLPTQLYHLCFGVDRVLSALKTAVPQEPVAYLAWRDGKPCWEGDDCVCEHAVYPVDHDDDRTSMPVYLAPHPQQPRLTDAEILTLWAQTYVERGTSGIEFARVIEAKVRGEA